MNKILKFVFISIIVFGLACKSGIKNEKLEWSGVWTYSNTDELTDFTLTVEKKSGDTYNCKIEAVGIQTYYLINCMGKEIENGFEVYYIEVLDGGFFQADFIENEKPILTLCTSETEVLTTWNQLVGGISNLDSFKKN